MKALNNTVEQLVARYARNRHRAEFVAANPGIPEEVLAVVYFRRQTAGRWWYAPKNKMYLIQGRPRWEAPGLKDDKWYEIPVCPEKIKKITQKTREKYLRELNHQTSLLQAARTFKRGH